MLLHLLILKGYIIFSYLFSIPFVISADLLLIHCVFLQKKKLTMEDSTRKERSLTFANQLEAYPDPYPDQENETGQHVKDVVSSFLT